MKIAEIRFLGTEQTFRTIVDARTIKAAEAILTEKLAAGTRSASFKIVGNAKKADRDSLPTIDRALAAQKPNALDDLAKIASGLGLSVNELAAELAITPATVQAWIEGTARPGENTRAELQIRVTRKLGEFRRGRVALHRIATLEALAVALQSASERRLWLAKRSEIRARYAR